MNINQQHSRIIQNSTVASSWIVRDNIVICMELAAKRSLWLYRYLAKREISLEQVKISSKSVSDITSLLLVITVNNGIVCKVIEHQVCICIEVAGK
jgi:hypothetical protein